MVYDAEAKVIRVSYPFRDCADVQPDNFRQVRKIQGNIEARVYAEGLDEAYNIEMRRMIEAGAVRKLEKEELRGHRGPVHYEPHFHVKNPESSSTKLRIVADSACKNMHSGKSFNDLISPVPNALNEITDVQLRWRMFPVSLVYDLSKAYHSLRTGYKELHLRRFLYRFSREVEWEVYGYMVVAFGDVPAALALELAKELVAESAQAVDAQAATQLTRNSLVDDIGGVGTRVEVDRMRGRLSEEGYSGTIPKVLESCGFRAKALVASGSQEEAELEAVGGKFLGMAYDPTSDELILQPVPVIRMKVKRSKQRRADNVPITEEWIEDLRAGRHQLTKRRVLAYVMSQYDPHGLREPV